MSVPSYSFHSLLLKFPNKGMCFPFPPLKLPNKGKEEYFKMILFIPFHSLLRSEALVFGRMEKWRNEKLLCLVEKKNEKMENEVGINL